MTIMNEKDGATATAPSPIAIRAWPRIMVPRTPQRSASHPAGSDMRTGPM